MSELNYQEVGKVIDVTAEVHEVVSESDVPSMIDSINVDEGDLAGLLIVLLVLVFIFLAIKMLLKILMKICAVVFALAGLVFLCNHMNWDYKSGLKMLYEKASQVEVTLAPREQNDKVSE